MPIQSMEIICRPCHHCELLKERIHQIIKAIEFKNQIRIKYQFVHTTTLTTLSRYSLHPSQTPVLLINGNVEIAGKVHDARLIRLKLEAINAGF